MHSLETIERLNDPKDDVLEVDDVVKSIASLLQYEDGHELADQYNELHGNGNQIRYVGDSLFEKK